MTVTIPDNYYTQLAHVESGGNPFAVNPGSSASGLYQFTKKTFQTLGFDWSQRFNVAAQNAAVQKVTQMNAQVLANNGLDINNENLYAAHFFGPTTATRVLTAPDNASLGSILGGAVLSSNPFLNGMTVGDFKNWLNQKMGGSQAGAQGGTGGGDLITRATNAVAGVVTAPKSILDFIVKFFSYHTAARFTAVIIGVLLIGLAIAALVLTNDLSPNNLARKAASI